MWLQGREGWPALPNLCSMGCPGAQIESQGHCALLTRPSRVFLDAQVTGIVFLFHLVVHLTAVTIDPAEADVRLRNYSKPMPTFDRSQHTHVIQNQYCYLCEVTV